MKILCFHPYGRLGDWNHRLSRQFGLIGVEHEVKVVGISPINEFGAIDANVLKVAIKEFCPDIIYVNGFMIASEVVEMFDKVIFDMGSVRSRNVLIESWKYKYPEMMREKVNVLRDRFIHAVGETVYMKEERAVKKAKAIIIWEGQEADFVKKMYGDNGNIREISMIFCDTPKPIPFDKKKNRAITIVSKFTKNAKNISLSKKVRNMSKEQLLLVGAGSDWKEFIPHDELMDELNQSKVFFCPFYCGGIGAINEALRLGCNVVAYGWYPYSVYLNEELIIDTDNDREVAEAGVRFIEKAMEKYYPLEKPLPTEQEQLDKLLKVFEEVKNG